MLPDLSRPFYEKRGRFYSQFNFIMWRSWLGLGKGEEGDRTHITPCLWAGWACRVDLCQGPAPWELHGHSPRPAAQILLLNVKSLLLSVSPVGVGVCVRMHVRGHACVSPGLLIAEGWAWQALEQIRKGQGSQAKCLLRNLCAGRQGASEGAAQGLPAVGTSGEPCVWEWGLLILGCLGGSLAPALRAPRAWCRGDPVMEGEGVCGFSSEVPWAFLLWCCLPALIIYLIISL